LVHEPTRTERPPSHFSVVYFAGSCQSVVGEYSSNMRHGSASRKLSNPHAHVASISPFLPAHARPRRSLMCPVHSPPRVSRLVCKLRSMVACTLSLHLQAAVAKGVVAHRESSRRQPRQIGVARRSPKRWWVNARRRRRLAARSLGRWLQRRRCSTAAARKSR
jgi:hypothetical protein